MPAAMDVLSPIGSTISICMTGKPASYTAAGYAALTWIEVGEVDSIGETGAESALNSRTRLKDGAVKKSKGARNYGALPLTLAMVPGDLGQQALRNAEMSQTDYPIMTKFPDGTIDYSMCFVMSFKDNIGNAEGGTIMSASNLEVNTKPIRVYPV